METIAAILAPVLWLLGWILSIVWWLVTYLLWAIFWFVLPFAVLAFIALRIAESMLGPDVVRAYIKKQSLKFGNSAWMHARRWTFALGALPLRVLGYFVVYALWHSLVSLLWRPDWHPWQRAWSKRWKPKAAAASKRKSAA